MGDFLPPPPGNGAEYERLRRRFERYRQLHDSRRQQYDCFASGVYNQQAHETQLLHRRWQDSKKPTAKSVASAKMASRVGDAAMPGAVPAAAATVTTVCLVWAIVQKWVPYSERYLFSAIPDTNHNANPTNPNRYSKGKLNPTNPTNPTLPTLLTLILDTVVNKAPTSAG